MLDPDVPTLGLLLDSPLQSWGDSSKFRLRSTGQHPTKSGVVGILAAALGIDRNGDPESERERVTALGQLNMASLRLPCHRSAYGQVRELPVTQLRDYQTVGGGYDEKTYQKLHVPKKADRGGTFGTVEMERYYLQHARFGVFLQGDREQLDACVTALQNPVWGVALGRRSCPPATPVLGTVADSRDKALSYLLSLLPKRDSDALSDRGWERFVRREEASPDTPGARLVSDQPESFAARAFAQRLVVDLLP